MTKPVSDYKASDLHVVRWGQSGPAVLMVHGGAQGGGSGGERNFDPQRPMSQAGWRMILPDRPGHGQSPDPGRPDDADLDGALIAQMLTEDTHLVGHSFGGCVALVAAATHPERIKSLTLIEPGMMKFAVSDPNVRQLVFKLMLASVLPSAPVKRAMKFMTLLGIPPEMRRLQDPEELKRMGASVRRGKLPTKAEIAQQLAVIKAAQIPLMVITGGWSPAFEATGNRVAAAGGGSRVVVKVGHHFPQLNAEEFNPILTDFLKTSEARWNSQAKASA